MPVGSLALLAVPSTILAAGRLLIMSTWFLSMQRSLPGALSWVRSTRLRCELIREGGRDGAPVSIELSSGSGPSVQSVT